MEPSMEWSDPPPVKKRVVRPSKYQPLIDDLKAHPGQWARVMTNVNAASGRVFVDAGCKTVVRTEDGCDKGRVNIYARYLGESDADDTPAPKAKKAKAAPKKAAPKRDIPRRRRPDAIKIKG